MSIVHLIVLLLTNALLAGGTYYLRARHALKDGKVLSDDNTYLICVIVFLLTPLLANKVAPLEIVPPSDQLPHTGWWLRIGTVYLLSFLTIWGSTKVAKRLSGYQPPPPAAEDEPPAE